MELKFNSKEESKNEQEQAFLALKPAQRVVQFIIFSSRMNILFPKKDVNYPIKTNFVLEK